jgi:hypothetical protein
VRRAAALAAAALALAAREAPAQQAPTPAPGDDSAPAVAVRITGRVPRLDGRLDDEAWAAAPAVSGFRQKDPAEGAPATEATEVRFVYDDHDLYVGARMASPGGRVQAPVSRRDLWEQAEAIFVSLDTYHNRRTAWTFGVTAAGTRVDAYHPGDSEEADSTFDPVWEARVARDSAGWTAELRIPLSQLRFNPGEGQTWGMNLRRWIPQKEEDDYWRPVPKSVTAWASRFGELRGISEVRPARRVELMPYVSAGASFTPSPDAGDPFHNPREASLRVGGDAKVGFGPNLTLDATVNPDFGQVDADPAVVNLSAYETFFAERRPFFTEGSQLLSGGGAGYFYSRRIGAAPHLPADGDFVDEPQSTAILGAAKLTGRLPSGLAVGVLGAVTRREWARTFTADSARFGRLEVEPATAYGVVRLQQELGGSGSTAGVILTGVHRALDGETPLAARLGRNAFGGAVDWDLRLGGNRYAVSGAVGFSRVAGDSLAIARLQRSSARYFQRPDAGYVELNPGATVLSGFDAQLAAQKISGEHWLWTVSAQARSPGFELNDAGQLSNADFLLLSGELRYRETRPRGPFRRWSLYVTPNLKWNWGGVYNNPSYYIDFEPVWKNFWRSWFTLVYVPRTQDPTLTRGGPLAQYPAGWTGIAQVASRSGARVGWNGLAYYARNEEGGNTRRLSGTVSVRPGPQWQLSVAPSYLRSHPLRQYVTSFSNGPAATFGRSYVFAAVDRSEFSAEVRLSYLFTPDLSLELYAQPFASSGRYHDFRELPSAGTYELAPLDGDTTRVLRDGTETLLRLGDESRTIADFNLRSFRSNAVMRWEWRPGSTLFVVWQQDRSGDLARIAPVGAGSLLETFDTPGSNYLAIKLSYWLPLR